MHILSEHAFCKAFYNNAGVFHYSAEISDGGIQVRRNSDGRVEIGTLFKLQSQC